MKKLPKRFDRLVFAFFMAGLMALIVSGCLTALHTGFDKAFLLRWLAAYALAFPIAFPTAYLVSPHVRKLTSFLVEP